MRRFFQWLRRWVIGLPPPRCPHLAAGESCHKHPTVATGMKVLAGIFAPALAIFWPLAFSNLPGQIADAQTRSDYGLAVAIAGLVVLWFVSFLSTVTAKFTSTGGYLMGGVAVPFTFLSVITPLIAATF